MKTNAIRKEDDLFIHGSRLKYITITVLAAVIVQSLIIIVFLLFNAIDL